MPFTPYHLGPALFLGLLFLRFIDFPTFLIASVIMDVEPFLVLFFNLNYPLHGFFHSLLGGTLVAIDPIPEFPSWTPLVLMVVAVLTVAVIYRRKLQNRGSTPK
jgi:hypothetical protein